MRTFVKQVAEALYNEYGEGLSDLHILLPSRRSRLFFTEALSEVVARPIWQPTFTSIEDIAAEISGLATADSIRLITELYKVYSQHHQETFDEFYFWGEMLLSDFDSIDKYLIDADALFTNISDLRRLEADLSYLDDEQRRAIARFWGSFGKKEDYSAEQHRFTEIWLTLGPVYHEFRRRLAAEGIGYPGMLYRSAAEKIRSQRHEIASSENTESRRYVIAGFNALSRCEKIIFDHLASEHHVDFFWDYDDYYVDNDQQEAGLFLRENIRRYPQRLSFPETSTSFTDPKTITVVSSPSDTMQCKYAATFLGGITSPGKETAIVLTDENLLMPLLHSIPDQVEQINVTMGYPLRLTTAYTFVERLLQLQSRSSAAASGRVRFHYSDAVGMLRHPFVVQSGTNDPANSSDSSTRQADLFEDQNSRSTSSEILKAASGIISRGQLYTDAEPLRRLSPLTETIFRGAEPGWQGLAEYLLEVISAVAAAQIEQVSDASIDLSDRPSVSREQSLEIEMLSLIAEHIRKLSNAREGCSVEITQRTLATLLRKSLQNLRIPFEGEPLEGVQVMGILETRNLDFENVMLLSVNDDTFPGNRAAGSSFIPYNLRLAYGLPTPEHHEGVYAYYFYRLLQRAKNVHLVYSSRTDERSSGEQSRYIYQLEYESRHTIERHTLGLDVTLATTDEIEIPKTGATAQALDRFLGQEPITLSPTSITNYIACPLRFYFYSVARLAPEKEITGQVDAPTFGTILHRAAEILYRPVLGIENPAELLAATIGTDRVEQAVSLAIAEQYAGGAPLAADQYGGNLILTKEIIIKYLNTCLLPFDASRACYTLSELEKRIASPIDFTTPAGERRIIIKGTADRIDKLQGGALRVVDYKTGGGHHDFRSMDELFGDSAAGQNPAAVQTLLYCMMLNRQSGKDAIPELYFIRQLNSEDYSPALHDKSMGPVMSYLQVADQFSALVRAMLSELFDYERAFTQCRDVKTCQWCDFNTICRRG